MTTTTDEQSIAVIADQKATLALLLAASGFIVLPVIASLFAVIVAHQTRRMMRGRPPHTRAGQVVAAMVMGYVGLAAGLAAVVYFATRGATG